MYFYASLPRPYGSLRISITDNFLHLVYSNHRPTLLIRREPQTIQDKTLTLDLKSKYF